MAKTKIMVRQLDLYYDQTQALNNISIAIEEKMVTALIGPSGCGKSTFLRTLNRMNELIPGVRVTGKVLLDGHDIYSPKVNPVDLRRRVGMVFQRPNPFPMSVFENVIYGPRIHGVKNKAKLEKIAEQSLRAAALWEEARDRLHQPALGLSGGQQQRLCIARQLAVEPEILLMDEPSSALDPVSTLKIEELIQTLKQNYTIVIVTHNMQQAARISEKCAFLLNGELIEYDDTATIFTRPKLKQTEDYITGRFG